MALEGLEFFNVEIDPELSARGGSFACWLKDSPQCGSMWSCATQDKKAVVQPNKLQLNKTSAAVKKR